MSELTQSYLAAYPRDAARILDRADCSMVAQLLTKTPFYTGSTLIAHMQERQSAQTLTLMAPSEAAALFSNLNFQQCAAILRRMSSSSRKKILAEIPWSRQVILNGLLRFSTTQVGAWCRIECLTLPDCATVEDALTAVASAHEEPGTFCYIVDAHRRLIGKVSIASLLKLPSQTVLQEAARPCEHRLSSRVEISTVIHHPGWTIEHSLPVEERNGHFVGVLEFTVLQKALKLQMSDSTGNFLGPLIEALVYAGSQLIANLLTNEHTTKALVGHNKRVDNDNQP